jgi:hypothetical protein
LHKTQFTVCVREQSGDKFKRYATEATGYEAFLKRVQAWQEAGHEVRVGVESTGNTRYFKSRMEMAGVTVKVINTLKFKVVNECVHRRASSYGGSGADRGNGEESNTRVADRTGDEGRVRPLVCGIFTK